MKGTTGTQAALLTPLAPGAIAVIGLRGPDAERMVNTLTRPKPSARAGAEPAARRALSLNRPVLRHLVEGAVTLDDVLVIRRRAAGRTSEHVELHVHGGVRIAQRILMLLERHGVRRIDAQTFETGDETSDPLVAACFAALLRTESRRLAEWLLAQREILPAFLAARDQWSTGQREDYERRTRAAIRLLRGIRIAIVGPPNAGKSTLANRLIGRDRVITSDLPGTTRDWVEETAMIDGWPVTLVDTAGVRETACAIESDAILRGTAKAREADLILIVVDGTLPSQRMSESLRAILGAQRDVSNAVLVVNKCDEPADAIERRDAFYLLHEQYARQVASVAAVSALHGTGMAALEAVVLRLLDIHLLGDGEPSGFLAEHLQAGTRM